MTLRYFFNTWIPIFVMSLLMNLGLYFWMGNHSLGPFRVAQYINIMDNSINDLRYILLTSNPNANHYLDTTIDEIDLSTLLDFARYHWIYKNDAPLWDVANPPVVAYLYLTGDCDDYARMAAYMAHRRGHKTFYVTMSDAVSSGHAVAVYYDDSIKRSFLVDVNTAHSIPSDGFDMWRDTVTLVHDLYPNYVYISMRTWDARKVVLVKSVKKEGHI